MSRERIFIKSKEEFDKAMQILNNLGYKWRSGQECSRWKPGIVKDEELISPIFLYLSSESSTITYTEEENGTEEDREEAASFLEFFNTVPKAGLENGMIIKTVNDEYLMYFKEFGKFIANDGFTSMGSYKDDLTNGVNHEYDVVAIYKLTDLHNFDDFGLAVKLYGELVWERPKPVEMTIAEIEKKLGIKNLKIVKEKNECSWTF